MKSRTVTYMSAMTLFAALAIPVHSAAQEGTVRENNARHHHYELIDLGTFGGLTSGTQDELQVLNSRGMVVGSADTSVPNITHAFQWSNNVLNDLGALPGDNSSGANWISDSGLVAGSSETIEIDPNPPFAGSRAIHAVLWKNGHITDLGTLEGGYESIAFSVNSHGQVAGAAFNGSGHQRPFLWENGVMHDLGTLGGPDAGLLGFKGNVEMNERGQVVACSATSTINRATGSPTIDPFLWDKEEGMIDLGTLGGTSGCAIYLNDRGQVVGYSSIAGDLTFHPFLWQKGQGMKDLGTLGGTFGFANWISDAGEIVGSATYAGDNVLHAFRWKNGIKTDLGTLAGDPCSASGAINSKGQIVGASEPVCFTLQQARAFLWENGGPMLDLNSLILPGSRVQLVFGAVDINDRGEIVGVGVLPNGDTHAVLLIPCDETHPRIEGCDYSMVDVSTLVPVRTVAPNVFRPMLPFSLWHPNGRFRFPTIRPKD